MHAEIPGTGTADHACVDLVPRQDAEYLNDRAAMNPSAMRAAFENYVARALQGQQSWRACSTAALSILVRKVKLMRLARKISDAMGGFRRIRAEPDGGVWDKIALWLHGMLVGWYPLCQHRSESALKPAD